MQLIRRPLLGYENRFSAGALREESADIIVPDSYPDILQIIDAKGLVCVKEKHVSDAGVELAGAIRVSVLYKPDDPAFSSGFNTVKKIEIVIPFTHVFEQRGLSDGKVFAAALLTSTSARTVNPRKVSVTACVHMDVQVYTPYSHELSIGMSESGFETLTKQTRAHMLESVRDKSIVIADQIELPSGRPPIGEILHAGVKLSTKETKVIGNKVVLKGGADVSILYQNHMSEAIALSTWNQEIMFSHIIETDTADESANIFAALTLAGIDLDLRGDGRTIDVQLVIDAQLTAVCERNVDALTDAYSTVYDIMPDMKELSLYTVPESFSARVQARESAQVNPSIHSIVDTEIILQPIEKTADGENTVLRCEAIAKVIYVTEDADYACAEIRIPVSAAVANPHGFGVAANVSSAGDVFSGVTAEGLEVRFAALFEGVLTERKKLSVVDGIRGDMETPRESDDRASVTLRRLNHGETLWDIAKRHCATQKDIMAANALLETTELETGTLLLIPRKR